MLRRPRRGRLPRDPEVPQQPVQHPARGRGGNLAAGVVAADRRFIHDDQHERRERFREARDEGEKKALAVLSAEQREQFEKLQGKKIEIDTSPLLQRRRDT
jgi:hypothetical protein